MSHAQDCNHEVKAVFRQANLFSREVTFSSVSWAFGWDPFNLYKEKSIRARKTRGVGDNLNIDVLMRLVLLNQ